ncbi:MAG TPA: dTDP-4-dehydrorhamnose reductase [Nitrospiraceae bacterium]|nr:dTDP-4-dehydrorhamnose reductase [Nitrospiraceae bacterium]
MRILLLGANGQVGSELQRVLRHHEILAATRPLFDITDPSIEDKIVQWNPQVVLHSAAFTKVDDAETNPDLAFDINVTGTMWVARGAAKARARLVYLSTDYVFDGKKQDPYTESDAVNPLNTYGRSKLLGEQEALAACPRTLIVRTSWVYGMHGHNFVKTILKLSAQSSELRVVSDQRGSPTYAYDLAVVIGSLIDRGVNGVIHAGGEGICSWYELACTIVQLVQHSCRVLPITSHESGRPAARPPFSALSPSRLHRYDLHLPPWQDGLRRFVAEYLAAQPDSPHRPTSPA